MNEDSYYDGIVRFAFGLYNSEILDDVVYGWEKTLWEKQQYYIIHSNYEGAPTPYLVRYVLYKSNEASIYIHRFLLSDDKVPHDHPFNFWTYVVSGGYQEERWPVIEKPMTKSLSLGRPLKELGPQSKTTKREPGTWAQRGKGDAHRVVLDRNYTLDERLEAPLSICFIDAIDKGSWGFYPDGKFVFAKDFLDSAHTDANQIPPEWQD